MATALGRAAAMAALSDYEAHPVAVMEALTLGTPVIGFDVAGVGDLAEDGLVRPMRPSATAEQVAGALREVLSAPRPGVTPGLPTWESCAEALAEVYRSAARSAP